MVGKERKALTIYYTELNSVVKKIDNFTLALVQQIPNPYKKRMV